MNNASYPLGSKTAAAVHRRDAGSGKRKPTTIEAFEDAIANLVVTSEDGKHLLWLGTMARTKTMDGTEHAYARLYSVPIYRFLFEAATGLDTGRARIIKHHSCNVERCVLPSHWELQAKFKDITDPRLPQDMALKLIDELGL